jgi:hypothetical protein
VVVVKVRARHPERAKQRFVRPGPKRFSANTCDGFSKQVVAGIRVRVFGTGDEVERALIVGERADLVPRDHVIEAPARERE